MADTERLDVWAKYRRSLSRIAESLGLSKIELRDAVNATDEWVDANASSYNSALPIEARTNMTVMQKAKLLLFIVDRRFEVS